MKRSKVECLKSKVFSIPGCAGAQGFLSTMFNVAFPEEIDPIGSSSARMENPQSNSQDNQPVLQTANVFPNPANDQVNISYQLSDDAEIIFYNLMGQQIEAMILQKSSNLTTVQTSDWSNGIYFYRIVTKDGSMDLSDKILISH